MSDPKLVFVVGAGASYEVGLPLGAGLKSHIQTKLDIRYDAFRQKSGSYKIVDALNKFIQDGYSELKIQDYQQAAWRVRDGLPQAISIDNFIDQQADHGIELCGKLAIVEAVLEAEANSKLKLPLENADKAQHFGKLAQGAIWYTPLWQMLTNGCRKEDLRERFKKVAFISFNYDRCIEYFLFHSVQNYYGVSAAEAEDLLSSIAIYHPYGSVGDLPYSMQSRGIGFGESVGGGKLLELAGKIRTFTEQVKDRDILDRIRQVIEDGEIIAFLGFAYHKQNIDLLLPNGGLIGLYGAEKRVFGTATGVSESSRALIEAELIEKFGISVSKASVKIDASQTCHSFFGEYERAISLN